LLEVNLIKIGKLATPAVIALGGVFLLLSNQLISGWLLVGLGVAVYLVVWRWSIKAAKDLVNKQLKREKLKIRTEQARKERILTQSQYSTEQNLLDKEKRKRKWMDRFGKSLWDSL